jgi:hypothetical protein
MNNFNRKDPNFKSLLQMAHVVENLDKEHAHGIQLLIGKIATSESVPPHLKATLIGVLIIEANAIPNFQGTFKYDETYKRCLYE